MELLASVFLDSPSSQIKNEAGLAFRSRAGEDKHP